MSGRKVGGVDPEERQLAGVGGGPVGHAEAVSDAAAGHVPRAAERVLERVEVELGTVGAADARGRRGPARRRRAPAPRGPRRRGGPAARRRRHGPATAGTSGAGRVERTVGGQRAAEGGRVRRADLAGRVSSLDAGADGAAGAGSTAGRATRPGVAASEAARQDDDASAATVRFGPGSAGAAERRPSVPAVPHPVAPRPVVAPPVHERTSAAAGYATRSARTGVVRRAQGAPGRAGRGHATEAVAARRGRGRRGRAACVMRAVDVGRRGQPGASGGR